VLAVLVSSGFRVITTGDKGKLFVLFIPAFIYSLLIQQECVLPVAWLINKQVDQIFEAISM